MTKSLIDLDPTSVCGTGVAARNEWTRLFKAATDGAERFGEDLAKTAKSCKIYDTFFSLLLLLVK
ncbi:unnamed protein product [Cylicostephanus goldi]|uniref:Uncharacterized protein n=1 Tax=Cylicostephanus goldi TaxID=71465 RepID=A0A3P6UQX5_CYLGO|nr:unnamed protein product [Cylicostephanus goldi]